MAMKTRIMFSVAKRFFIVGFMAMWIRLLAVPLYAAHFSAGIDNGVPVNGSARYSSVLPRLSVVFIVMGFLTPIIAMVFASCLACDASAAAAAAAWSRATCASLSAAASAACALALDDSTPTRSVPVRSASFCP